MEEKDRKNIKAMGINSCPVLIKEGGNAIGIKAIMDFFTGLSSSEVKSKSLGRSEYSYSDHESYALDILQEGEGDSKSETMINYGSIASSKAAELMQSRGSKFSPSLLQQKSAPISSKHPTSMIPQQSSPSTEPQTSGAQKQLAQSQQTDYESLVSDFLQDAIKQGGE